MIRPYAASIALARHRGTTDRGTTMTPPYTVLLLVIALASCAEMRWEKPGASAAALEKALGECRQRAQLEAMRAVLPIAPPVVSADPQGRPVVVQPPPTSRESDRFLAEQDLTHACM